MNLGQLASKARDLVQKRGGTESLKQDAEELRDIASGSGSMSDKAKAAAGALKDPGAGETPSAASPEGARPEGEAPREDAPGDRERRARRGRRRRRERGT
jgi:hypothetical protein